jgi:hypothetical protein
MKSLTFTLKPLLSVLTAPLTSSVRLQYFPSTAIAAPSYLNLYALSQVQQRLIGDGSQATLPSPRIPTFVWPPQRSRFGAVVLCATFR